MEEELKHDSDLKWNFANIPSLALRSISLRLPTLEPVNLGYKP